MAYPRSSVPPCEAVPALDVRPLWRNGQLRAGRASVITWRCDGEVCAQVCLEAEPDAVVLVFKTTAGETVRQRISLAFTPCHFGKERPWFVCPQCRRRIGVLYVVTDPAFSCRKCCCLRYAAQSESRGMRGLNAARKIRTSLGGGPSLYDPFPRRPVSVRREVYVALRARYNARLRRLGLR